MTQNVLDTYDHEVEAILALLASLNERAKARRHNYGDFEREIREKFAGLGFTVDVNWYEFEVSGRKQDGAMPEITVTGRTDKDFTFDPDRQVHEVTSDVLGLGDEGVIKTDKETVSRLLDGHGGHQR
ncbi:MAG: hypothetical protein JWM19_867 [Actinomycetia bacterium]|nr:hypothetical protein [Actinomycetes bacterium]